MAVEESQLVDKNRSKGETLSIDQSPGGNLPMHLEDGLEMLVEVLVGHAAQLVKDPPHFDAIIGVRVSSSLGGDQKPLGAFACLLAAVLRVFMPCDGNRGRAVSCKHSLLAQDC